jgi:hypothetical protein
LISDDQLARVLRDSLDLKWGGELYADGMGGNYHQCGQFDATIEREGQTLVLGSNDDFYSVPINIALLRENLRKIGVEV